MGADMTFAEFYRAIHRHPPFPWQEAAAARLLQGEPLDAICVPTAAGKSALLDIALFAALQGGRRRICFAVDRRLVVDQIAGRLERIQRALEQRPELAIWRDQAEQLQAVKLRGGMSGDDDWIWYPERITVLVATIDQIGSRLLFRGYGTSSRMQPLHAGFLGNDLLLLLDEAHLSVPFIQTLSRLRRYGADVQTILLSATLPHVAQAPLALGPADHENPVLAKRLNASKPAHLMSFSGPAGKWAQALTKAAWQLKDQLGGRPLVGVVVNRVHTARKVFELLQAHAECDALLLIGRNRPYERDRLLHGWLPCLEAGCTRHLPRPLFVVATQTIEVGADFDFDGLVTESAPLSALRQRFGRLNRLGRRDVAPAIILHWDKKTADPIYGEALGASWQWLQAFAQNGQLDFGIAALQAALEREPPPAEPIHNAPVLLPAHLQLLQQTGPIAPNFDIAPFLHGISRPSTDVAVIWRVDLNPKQTEDWPARAQALPPMTEEALEIPLASLRRWLAGTGEVDDLDDLVHAPVENDTPAFSEQPVLRWRGSDDIAVVGAADLRPGDTVLLPAQYGGCDLYGWHPESRQCVVDLAELCSATHHAYRHAVRLDSACLRAWMQAPPTTSPAPDNELTAATIDALIDQWLTLAQAYLDLLQPPQSGQADEEVDEEALAVAETALRDAVATLARESPIRALGGHYLLEHYPGTADRAGLILRRNRQEEIGGATTAGVAVLLDEHQTGVADWCHRLAAQHPQLALLVASARHHDEGKREPRFQQMLYGSPLRAAAGQDLAKSGLRGQSALRLAWKQSGLPKGFRHELASLAYQPQTTDLATLLVGTHHGHGRPWFGACAEPDATGQALGDVGAGWAGRFLQQAAIQGPWQLAELELLLRAADARRSREEQPDAD